MYIINFFDPTGVVAPQCWKVCTDHVNYSFYLIHRVSDILSWKRRHKISYVGQRVITPNKRLHPTMYRDFFDRYTFISLRHLQTKDEGKLLRMHFEEWLQRFS